MLVYSINLNYLFRNNFHINLRKMIQNRLWNIKEITASLRNRYVWVLCLFIHLCFHTGIWKISLKMKLHINIKHLEKKNSFECKRPIVKKWLLNTQYFKICSKHIFRKYALLLYQILLHTKIIYNISKLCMHMLCKVPSIFKLIHIDT